jgi:hypothetical protein
MVGLALNGPLGLSEAPGGRVLRSADLVRASRPPAATGFAVTPVSFVRAPIVDRSRSFETFHLLCGVGPWASASVSWCRELIPSF